MRRFKQSLFARLTSRTIIALLLLNFVVFGLGVQKANAQFRTGTKQWAVLDFVNKSKLGGPALGGAATDAVSTLLLGTNKYDILPRETVERVMKEQELTSPLTRQLDILRVSQALGVETTIVGEITDARINKSANGKSADVVMTVKGIDVSSGLAVIGASVHGQSSERPGDVSDDVVLNEAISYGAQQAVSQMLATQVDLATVLTTPTVSSVVLNKGSRQGIKLNMRMVVTRGREQVAEIRVSEVSQDVSTAAVTKSYKGIAPGDRARAILSDLPNVTLKGGGGARIRTARRSDTSGALMALLVVGALALTIQSGSGDAGPGDLVSEASVLDDGITPGVKLSWKPSIFNGGRGRIEWQIWRNDYQPTPVLIVNGLESKGLDHPIARTLPWRNMGSVVGGLECIDDPGAEDFAAPAPGVVPGTTYQYLISLVYKVSSLDLPGGGTGTATDCYFQTSRQAALGTVTPIDPQNFESGRLPVNGTSVERNGSDPQFVQFQWGSAPGANQYVIEVSTRLDFKGGASSVRVVGTLDTTLTGTLGLDPVNMQPFFPNATRLYWRVGARNAGDTPGPVKDSINERYVFGTGWQIDRIDGPPPPGQGKRGGGKG